MGARGPIPKRSDQRRRRNKPDREVVKAPKGKPKVACPVCSKQYSPGGGMASHMRAAHPEVDTSPKPEPDVPVFEGREPADPKWHHVATVWYESLLTSGQNVFYEPSDWALAFVIAESISRELNPHQVVVTSPDGENSIEEVSKPPKGASLAAWLKGMSALLVAEGDRRRLQIELTTATAASEETGSVSSLAAWKRRVDGTG